MKKCLGLALAVAVSLPLPGTAELALKDVTVVYADAYGKTPYRSSQDAPFGKPAAEDLARILSLTTGGKVKAVSESQWEKTERESREEKVGQQRSRPVVYIGPCRAAKGIDVSALSPSEFRVKVEGGRAFLLGRTETASSFAVTEFLERFCGYRFLAQNGENPYEVKPDRTVADCDFTLKPVIGVRSIYRGWIGKWAKPDDFPKTAGNWWNYFRQRRLMLRQSDIPPSRRVRTIDYSDCHLVFKYLPTAKYAKAHPEWYSMDPQGRRTCIENGDCQLCYTNPEMRDEFTKNLLAMIEADKKANPTDYAHIYDMGQGDNTSFLCCCPDCKKVIAKYNAKAGGHWEGGDAGLQLEFANDIVHRVNKIHPEIKVRVFSYVSTAVAPKGIKADPNVVIWWCDVYTFSDHMRPLADPMNKAHLDEYLGWLATGAEVELWDYMLYGTVPEVNAEALQADLRLFRDRPPARYFSQFDYAYQPFCDLHMYLFDKLSFDPDADLDKLIGEWCAVYGRAAEKMHAVIRRLMVLERDNPPKSLNLWHQRVLPWYTAENFESLRADCEAAYRLEDRPFMRSRIALVLAGINGWLRTHYAGLYGRDADVARATSDFARYEKEWATVEHTDPAKRAATAAKVEARAKVRTVRFKDLPPGCADVPAADLKCLDSESGHWRAHSGSLIAIEADPSSETGKTCIRRYPSGRKPPEAMTGGVYDIPLKKVLMEFKLPVTKEMRDGKYRWYRLGTAQIGKDSYVWLTGDWHSQITLKGFHLLADGAEADLNTYEIWVSFKFDADWFAFDRAVLKRAPAVR